jgi:hypothetical protein
MTLAAVAEINDAERRARVAELMAANGSPWLIAARLRRERGVAGRATAADARQVREDMRAVRAARAKARERFAEKVRECHALGYSDWQTGEELLPDLAKSAARNRVRRCRVKVLQLPAHPSGRGATKGRPTEAVRERLRAGLRKMLDRLGYVGVGTLGELRADKARAAAAAQGWPPGCTPAHAAVLAALAAHGRLTTRGAAARCAKPIAATAAAKYLRTMLKLGWVRASWWAPPGQRRRRVWELAPAVLAGRRRWEQTRRQH